MKPFVDWINEFNLQLGLDYTLLDWTKELSIDAFDIQCDFRKDGKTYSGRGTAVSRELAVIKSTAEVLERFFLDQLHDADSSNGVAVHTECKLAELAALFELLERDSFFCHFLTRTPFQEFDLSGVSKSALSQNIISLLKSKKAEIRIAKMRTDPRFSSVICAIFGLGAQFPFGMTLGTSVKLTLEEAIDAALIESARSAIAYLSNPHLLKVLIDEKKHSHFSRPEDHLIVGLKSDYAADFRESFFRNGFHNSRPSEEEIDFDKISISSFQPELFEGSISMNPPLFLARASSSSLMNLFFGEFEVSEEKIHRLNSFLGREVSEIEINTTIHPFA
jgi:ribosomal protein S12 methylthiotransferase accessory factor YcaO